jgi:hypothetical protein
MKQAYCKIVNNQVVAQEVFSEEELPVNELWLPVVVESPVYNRATHYETRRENRIESDRVVRVRVIEPREVNLEHIKEEARRRIIELTGSSDIISSILKQINEETGVFKVGIKKIRDKSNLLEAMNPLPIDFRDDKHWV